MFFDHAVTAAAAALGAGASLRFRGSVGGGVGSSGSHVQPTNQGLFGHGGHAGSVPVNQGVEDDVRTPADERAETESQVLLQQYYEWHQATPGAEGGVVSEGVDELEGSRQGDANGDENDEGGGVVPGTKHEGTLRGGDGSGGGGRCGGGGGMVDTEMVSAAPLPTSTAPPAAPPPHFASPAGAASPFAAVYPTPAPVPSITPASAPTPAPAVAASGSRLLEGVDAGGGDPLSLLANQAKGGEGGMYGQTVRGGRGGGLLGDEDGGSFDAPPDLWQLEASDRAERAPGDVFE